MAYILLGVLGAVLALGLVAGGFAAGWKMNNFCREKTVAAAAEALTEQEKQRLKEDQEAFQELLNYNADKAYGLDKYPGAD